MDLKLILFLFSDYIIFEMIIKRLLFYYFIILVQLNF